MSVGLEGCATLHHLKSGSEAGLKGERGGTWHEGMGLSTHCEQALRGVQRCTASRVDLKLQEGIRGCRGGEVGEAAGGESARGSGA